MNKKDELINQWIIRAEGDLKIAKLALDHNPNEFLEAICFHCQQAAEKYIKAYLVHKDIEFRKTHILSYLLDLLNAVEEVSDDFYEIVETLDGYAVEIRYPDAVDLPSVEEAFSAYDAANKIKNLIQGKMGYDK